MHWFVLGLAGLVEIAWSQSIKPTQNFTRPGPTVVCALLGVAAVYLLAHAMQTLPVGTAYAVFTGIGAVGAVTLGIVLHHDPLSLLRVLALSLIVAGLVLARVATPE